MGSLPKYGETYTLTLQDAARARPAVVLSRSVAAWIYDDGEVHLPGITADAARLLADLQAAKKRENKKQR